MSAVSVLFNEPKLLKSETVLAALRGLFGFSALQRAEIAEIQARGGLGKRRPRFSALQRAEIAEIVGAPGGARAARGFQCSSTSRNC